MILQVAMSRWWYDMTNTHQRCLAHPHCRYGFSRVGEAKIWSNLSPYFIREYTPNCSSYMQWCHVNHTPNLEERKRNQKKASTKQEIYLKYLFAKKNQVPIISCIQLNKIQNEFFQWYPLPHALLLMLLWDTGRPHPHPLSTSHDIPLHDIPLHHIPLPVMISGNFSCTRLVRSPPSSRIMLRDLPSGQNRVWLTHQMYSSSVSPFQAYTATPVLAMAAAAWSCVEKMLQELHWT